MTRTELEEALANMNLTDVVRRRLQAQLDYKIAKQESDDNLRLHRVSGASPFMVLHAEHVARKIEAIRNYEYPEALKQITEKPRIIEALYFLQFISMQPGALVKFSQDLVRECANRIGTATMRDDKPRALSQEEKFLTWNEIPIAYSGGREHGISVSFLLNGGRVATKAGKQRSLKDILVGHSARACQGENDICADLSESKAENIDRSDLVAEAKACTYGSFLESCRRAAENYLPSYLAALCVQLDKPFAPDPEEVWFMDDPLGAVFEMMDRHEQQAAASLAHTQVTDVIFSTMDRAIETKDMVLIWGNPRFGKTEALKAKALMQPGLLRFFPVPSSNTMQEFLAKLREVMGIEAAGLVSIRAAFRRVVKNGGPVPVFDEAAFLLPRVYGKTTAPARLDWVRTELFDNGLPTIMAATPQSYTRDLKRFVETTGYAMEQFSGRCERVLVPEQLSYDDLVKVAMFHFPEIKKERDLLRIAHCAVREENFLQTIERISKRARFTAKRRGIKAIAMPLVEETIEAMFPSKKREQESAAPARAGSARPAELAIGSRGIRPAMADEFPDRSLRGNGLDPARAELVQAEP